MNSVRCKFNNPPMTISLICPQYLPVCNPPPFLSNCMRFLSFCQRDFVVKTVSFFFFSFLMFFSFQSPLISPNWKKRKERKVTMDGWNIYLPTDERSCCCCQPRIWWCGTSNVLHAIYSVCYSYQTDWLYTYIDGGGHIKYFYITSKKERNNKKIKEKIRGTCPLSF